MLSPLFSRLYSHRLLFWMIVVCMRLLYRRSNSKYEPHMGCFGEIETSLKRCCIPDPRAVLKARSPTISHSCGSRSLLQESKRRDRIRFFVRSNKKGEVTHEFRKEFSTILSELKSTSFATRFLGKTDGREQHIA